MNWSPQQVAALSAVKAWLQKKSDPLFRLFGYAGTGKTTLARHLAEGVSGKVLFAAYTGKAAYVMRQKGCREASTLHSLIYCPWEKCGVRLRQLEAERDRLKKTDATDTRDARLAELAKEIEAERESLDRPAFTLNRESPLRWAALLVVDECSMVDEAMARDLLSFGVKLLVLGDPAQLPPVYGAGYFTKGTPNVMLSEVHRQARDNPIIDLATKVRLGEGLRLGQYGTSSVISTEALTPGLVLGVDQVLVGRNRTRQQYNNRIRTLRGYKSKFPQPGERLVCLRNNHEIGLLNGGLWKVLNSRSFEAGRIGLELEPEDGGPALTVEAHTHYFLGRDGKDLDWMLRREAEEFDFGYVLTCHKAQGSQWGSVMVFDESGAFQASSRQWLYTAITRAAERVTIVREPELG